MAETQPQTTITAKGTVPEFSLDDSLIEYTVTKHAWLQHHDKHFDSISTAAVVFDPQNRMLLIQRAPHDSMPNLWETPGGAVDSTDLSILHGAARELREETGLHAKKMVRLVTEGEGKGTGERWSVFTNSKGTMLICCFGFEVEVDKADEVDVVLDPNEHQDWVWAREEEVLAGVTAGGKKIPLTGEMMRNRVAEAFRLRKL